MTVTLSKVMIEDTYKRHISTDEENNMTTTEGPEGHYILGNEIKFTK